MKHKMLNPEDLSDPPEEFYSYLIFEEGGSYKAKNGTTGLVEFNGTLEEVIQDAFSMGPGTIVLKELKKPTNLAVPDDVLLVEHYLGKEILYWGERVFFPHGIMDTPLPQFRSERYREKSEVVSDFETIADWTLVLGQTLSVDTEHFKQGNQGIKFTSINNAPTSADRAINLNVLGNHFELWAYLDNWDNFERIVLYCPAPNFANYFRIDWLYTPAARYGGLYTGWNKLLASRAQFTVGAGAPDWTKVTGVRLYALSKAGTTLNATFDDLRMVRDRFAAKVTLRLDDLFISQFTEARKRMDKYGFRGVEACYTSGVGGWGHLTLDQLKLLQERGWDIISHCVNHIQFDLLSDAEAIFQLSQSQKWLVENGFIKGSRFFIPPSGATPPPEGVWVRHWEKIKKYYLACQPLVDGYDSIPPADQYRMFGRAISATTPLATVTGWIDEAKENKAWLTLIFHDIAPYTALFQSIIDYVYASGLEVVTFSDVFDDLIVQEVAPAVYTFGIQGVITPNGTQYLYPGSGPTTVNLVDCRETRSGVLKNLYVRQRVASGALGRTDIYTVMLNGVATAITCTLDNSTEGQDTSNIIPVSAGDRIGIRLVSNDFADSSADCFATLEFFS